MNFLQKRCATKTEVQRLSQFLSLYPKPYARIIIRNALYIHISVMQKLFMLYQVIENTNNEKVFGFKIQKLGYSKRQHIKTSARVVQKAVTVPKEMSYNE